MLQADTIHNDTLALPFYMIGEAYAQPENNEVNVGIPVDSLFRPCDAPDTVFRTTLFTGHKLVPQHDILTERPVTAPPSWVFAVMVGICAFLYIFYHNHKLRISELLRSTVDGTSPERVMHTNVQGLAFLPIALLLSCALAMTLWIAAMRPAGFVGYLLMTVVIAVAYLLRNGVLTLLASVFDGRQTMDTYIVGNYGYHLLLSTITAPLLFAIAYIPNATDVVSIAIAVLTGVVFVMRFINGCKLFLTKSKNFSFFLFYYLCIIETIPLLVVLRWIISQ